VDAVMCGVFPLRAGSSPAHPGPCAPGPRLCGV